MATPGLGRQFITAIRNHWERIRYPLGAFFGWLSLVIGIVASVPTLVELATTNTTARERVLSFSLAAIAMISLGALAWREVLFANRNKLAGAFPQLERASFLLRDLRSYLRKNLTEARRQRPIALEVLPQARAMIGEILTIYADIYSHLTTTRCRTCVKMIGARDSRAADHPEDFIVFALSRDRLSAEQNKMSDKKRAEGGLDKLIHNTDFLRLWDPSVDDEGYFFSNDLRYERDYQTSSLNYHRNIANNPNLHVQEDWPLWYVATIVWPIRQEVREDLGIMQQLCLGFLTVDSSKPDAFDRQYHPIIGKLLANALFPILGLYTALQAAIAHPDAENDDEGERQARPAIHDYEGAAIRPPE